MPSGDISRFLQQSRKHYAGVRLQQGRALLDSDYNEQAGLAAEGQRQALHDLVGAHGSPNQGFSIGQPFPPPSAGPRPDQTPPLRPQDDLVAETVVLDGVETQAYNVTVRMGSMHVGGMRCEEPHAESIAFQGDFLQMTAGDLPAVATSGDVNNLYYLHVFEQWISSVEDQELGEAMLRGPDTSMRVRRVQRVQVRGFESTPASPLDAFDAVINDLTSDGNASFDPRTSELESAGRLQITFRGSRSADPCSQCQPGESRFLGTENAALRIMLTEPGRFVWALDDGSPIYRVRVTGLTGTPTQVKVDMLTLPVGEDQLPLPGRVVEILPFGALLDGGDLPAGDTNPHQRKVPAELGVFSRVTSFNRADQSFTLSAGIPAIQALVHEWDPNHPDAGVLNVDEQAGNIRYFFARFWHVAATDADIDLDVTANRPLGDTGVVPVFHHTGRPGDYWIAALRLDIPDRVVPFDLLTTTGGVPPHGPRHFYAPLALLSGAGGEVLENADARLPLRPVTDKACITWTVGDGIGSIGDFTSIQAAIDALPSQGGRVSVRPGFYAEQILIDRRRGIILEGCGAATVIESPLRSPRANLIEIQDCDGVSITGLTLNAAEQRAIFVRQVTGLTLDTLAVVAGASVQGAFSPNTGDSQGTLVDIAQSGSLDIQGLVFQPGVRPSLLVVSCELVTLRDLTLVGVQQSAGTPTTPMVTISSSELVKIEDCTWKAFGQVALSLRGNLNHDVEMSGLSIDASSHGTVIGFDASNNAIIGILTETRSAIDIDGGAAIRLARSRLTLDGSQVSEHAALVVHGLDVVIEGNTIEAQSQCFDVTPQPECGDLRAAWGGIQIRGGSAGVEIRRNRIIGGLGHGITLGGVLWRLADSPIESPLSPPRSPLKSPPRFLLRSPNHQARRVGGAGTGQLLLRREDGRVALGRNLGDGIEDETGANLAPVNEGPIVDLVIADNRIEGMFSNGISALTVLGLQNQGGGLIEVERARIEGNIIRDNVQRPGDSMPRFAEALPFPASTFGEGISIPFVPFGGIVLAAATGGCDIRNNIIRSNGNRGQTAPFVPVNGIFILNGDGISISGNRITENGDVPSIDKDQPPLPGVRAGIAVMLAGTGPANDLGEVNYFLEGKGHLDAANFSLRVVGNSVRQPEGRALHAVATGAVTIERNFFSSRGNHGSNELSDLFMVGDVVFVQNLGTPWEASDLEPQVMFVDDPKDLPRRWVVGLTPETRFSPPPPPQDPTFPQQPAVPPASASSIQDTAIRYLLNQARLRSPEFFVGTGGALQFHGNQVSYDWELRRLPPPRRNASSANGSERPTPLSFFPTALLTLDHLAISANQFAFRLQIQNPDISLTGLPEGHKTIESPPPVGVLSQPLISNVFGIGGTVNVTGNRSSEQLGLTTASIVSIAEIQNLTAYNQSSSDSIGFVSRNLPSELDPIPATSSSAQVKFGAGPLATIKRANFEQRRNDGNQRLVKPVPGSQNETQLSDPTWSQLRGFAFGLLRFLQTTVVRTEFKRHSP
jgi:hypothetical protein